MKQRVLLANKFHYRRGGDCVVMMTTQELLRRNGHETGVFAMTYDQNIDSPDKDTFAPEVRFNGPLGDKIKAMGRTLGLGDIRSCFNRKLDEFRPDVVHLHNIHSYLSPVLAELAHRRGIRVVWTLHDYKLVCPSYSCLTPDGTICEDCLTKRSAVLTKRCMKGSASASLVAWLESLRWNRRKLESVVDRFICPSSFMATMMEKGGFTKEKLSVLSNFNSAPEAAPALKEREPYMAYAGRLSPEKGVGTLLEAASRLPYKLRIAGDGPIATDLKRQYGGNDNISFMGHLSGNAVAELMRGARFSVISSEWYENNPLGVIESLCQGTPVVGARIGGIPELLDPTNGVTYESGNAADLERALRQAWEMTPDYRSIQAEAQKKFSPDTHYHSLLKIYTGKDSL